MNAPIIYQMFYWNMFFNNFVFVRFRTSTELEASARAFQRMARNIPTSKGVINKEGRETDGHRFISLWQNSLMYKDKDVLHEMFNGRKPWQIFKDDEDSMKISLSNSAEAKMTCFNSFAITNALTGKAPLLDMVINNRRESLGNFAIPSISYLEDIQCIRSVSSSTLLSGHEVMEVTIGTSTLAEVEAAITFFNARYTKDQDAFPTGVISYDVESIFVSKDQAELMPMSLCSYPRPPFCFKKPEPGVPAELIPAKLILGGQKWTLSVRFDISTKQVNGKVEYQMRFDKIQPSLAEFLADLPAATGFGVRDDVSRMEDFIQRVGDPLFQFNKGFVEITAVAAVAGYHSERTTMFNMTFQVLGGILNKINSQANGLWSLPYDELPDAFKIYIIGDTRSGYNVYTVLMTALLMNMFPEPHIVCTLTGTSQAQFVAWFCSYILAIVQNLELSLQDYREAKTREDLVMCLRVREPKNTDKMFDLLERDDDINLSDTEDSLFFEAFGRSQSYLPDKLRPEPPVRVAQLAQILPPWPTVVYGGARFLLSTRKFVFSQLDVLKDLNLFGVLNIWSDVNQSPQLVDYALFGRELVHEIPFQSSQLPFLCLDPDLKYPAAVMNPKRILYTQISSVAACQGRPTRMLILEWIMLNGPHYAEILLERASERGGKSREDRFWFAATSMLEEVRALYVLLTCKKSPSVCMWAEKRIDDYLQKAKMSAQNDRKRLAEDLAVANAREKALADLTAMGPQFKRTKMSEIVPQVPPVKTAAQIARARRLNKQRKLKAQARKRAAKEASNQGVAGESANTGVDNALAMPTSSNSEKAAPEPLCPDLGVVEREVIELETEASTQENHCPDGMLAGVSGVSSKLQARLGSPMIDDGEIRTIRVVPSPPPDVDSFSVLDDTVPVPKGFQKKGQFTVEIVRSSVRDTGSQVSIVSKIVSSFVPK